MDDLNKKNYYLDFCGLCSIGMFSLGYVVFYSSFAEFNIQFAFLNFPIFVGEILFFICFVLFFIKYSNEPEKFTKWQYLIICYFIFVIIKAQYGYFKWGSSPLALRHAALLYYPAFAVFGYAFFRKDFFSKEKCLILFLLIFMAFAIKYHDYWTLTLMFLGLILVRSYPDKAMKLIMFLVLFVVIPCKIFFHTSRMMIVSNFLAGLYLAGTLPVVLKINRKFKLALTMAIGAAVILGLYKLADHGALRSIVAFKRMVEVVRASDEYIKANSGYFRMEERKDVKLYNPQGVDRGDYSRYIVYNGKMLTELEAKAEYTQDIVKDVKEKIANFSFEGIDQEAQRSITQEVKEEIVLILDQHVPQATQKPSEELPEPETSSMKKEAHATGVEVVGREMEPASALAVREEMRGPSRKKQETAIAKAEAQDADREELKAEIRQMLFEQVKKEIQKVSAAESFDGQPYPILNDIKQEMEATINRESGVDVDVPDPSRKKDWDANNNAVFRILIWRDMIVELLNEKPRLIYGFDFGKPLRSRSLEILDWGSGDWARDGWIEPHNSFLHIIYRTGIVGVILIFSLVTVLFKMIRQFVLAKSFAGIVLCGILIHWFAAANFLLIFELPYTAIPIWTIYGMTLAYCHKVREENYSVPQEAGIFKEKR